MCPESKKSKGTGRPSKQVVPLHAPDSVFVQMLQESGVTLRQGVQSNEIGKILIVVEIRSFIDVHKYYIHYIFLLNSCGSSCVSKKTTTVPEKESQIS